MNKKIIGYAVFVILIMASGVWAAGMTVNKVLSAAEVEAISYYCPDYMGDNGTMLSGVRREVKNLIEVGIAHMVRSYQALQDGNATTQALTLRQKYNRLTPAQKAAVDALLNTPTTP